jgi:hypothetical protein
MNTKFAFRSNRAHQATRVAREIRHIPTVRVATRIQIYKTFESEVMPHIGTCT